MVTRDTIMYHGTARLYHINGYLRARYEQVANYLRKSLLQYDPGTGEELNNVLPARFQQELQVRYRQFLDQSYDSYRPVIAEVLYAMTVDLLERYKLTQYSVYAIWNALCERRSVELLRLAEDLEEGHRSLQEVFYVEFYSTMGLPVQFFSYTYAEALQYANRDSEGCVLKYTVRKQLSLPDLSDPETVIELGKTVYASDIPFSLDQIQHHAAIDNYEELRESILVVSLEMIGWETLHQVLTNTCDPIQLLPQHPMWPNTTLRNYAENWSHYFRKELLAPSTLWKYTNWTLPRYRIALYDSDALLLRVMYDHGEYQGYYNPANRELAILDPASYGTMNTADLKTDPAKCPYTLP